MNTNRGFVVPLLLIIIALLVAGGGAYVYEKNRGDMPVVVPETAQATSSIPIAPITASEVTVAANEMRSFPLDRARAMSADVASIQKDYGGATTGLDAQIVYENESRIYFYPLRESEGCEFIHYLDKRTLEYYDTDLRGCPDIRFEDTKPYYLDEPEFSNFSDNPSLYVVNLDTGKRTEIYKPSDQESLLAGYFGDYGKASAELTLLDANRLSIGIYKRYANVSDMTMKNQYGDISAEKIRDQIVSFRVQ